MQDTAVVQIPGEILADVPILRWKLIENYQQSAAHVVRDGDRAGAFVWRDTFSIHVAQMDDDHKRLVEIANAIVEHLRQDADRSSLARVFDALVDYTQNHFEAEERLLLLYGYPAAEGHCRIHRDLRRQVDEYVERVLGGDVPNKAGFVQFFESWMVRHILNEDRKYGAFLNAKGVY